MTDPLRAALLACVLLAGCSRWQYDLGEPIRETAVAGATRLDQVLLALGPPQRMAAGKTGYVLAWEYWRITETSVGFSLGALGADALSFDWGGAEISGEFLLLGFDRQHRLLDRAFSRVTSDAGGGVAVQPIPGGPDLTNVDELLTHMPQHRWGAGMLERLPKALNAASEPELGGRALEQRGTPVGIGQRTLEMD